MCEGRSEFEAKEFHSNIIVATLHEKARLKFINRYPVYGAVLNQKARVSYNTHKIA